MGIYSWKKKLPLMHVAGPSCPSPPHSYHHFREAHLQQLRYGGRRRRGGHHQRSFGLPQRVSLSVAGVVAVGGSVVVGGVVMGVGVSWLPPCSRSGRYGASRVLNGPCSPSNRSLQPGGREEGQHTQQ